MHSLILLISALLFDWSLLPSKKALGKTLVIGNIRMGGTGKSPVTIAMLELLQEMNLSAAFLSRGYGRETTGFISIVPDSTANEVGDEPLMIANKFKSIPAAVCEDRLHGIHQLLLENSTCTWVVLDDAFQHRKLISDVSLLLTNYSDLYIDDFVFPLGDLRDLIYRASKANVVGITYVPKELCNEQTAAYLRERLALNSNQKLVLFYANYESPKAIQGEYQWNVGAPSYLFSGLANNNSFFERGIALSRAAVCKSFPDHHNYSIEDIEQILHEWRTFDSNETQILTTEKDAVKIKHVLKENRVPIFYLPLRMEIGFGKEDLIDLITMKTRV